MQINIDMLKAIRLIEVLTGEKLVHMADLEGNVILKKENKSELDKLREENQNLKDRLSKIEAFLSLDRKSEK